MNTLRLIRYFALFIVFRAEHSCAPIANWPGHIQAIIDAASNVEPREKLRVNIQNILFEEEGEIVRSYADRSLTLIVNEHSVERERKSSGGNSSKTLVYHHFEIRSTNSDSRSESILAFWSIQIKTFVYLVSTGSKIKLTLVPVVNESIIIMNFLNPRDAELFWHYALKNRNRSKVHMIDLLRFEIFNRQTKEKIEDSPFAVVHKEWAKSVSTTFTISLESDGVTQKPLLIFLSERFTVSGIIEDRMAIQVSDEPNLIFILQFSPFENDAAEAFHVEMFHRRCYTMRLILDQELRTFID